MMIADSRPSAAVRDVASPEVYATQEGSKLLITVSMALSVCLGAVGKGLAQMSSAAWRRAQRTRIAM